MIQEWAQRRRLQGPSGDPPCNPPLYHPVAGRWLTFLEWMASGGLLGAAGAIFVEYRKHPAIFKSQMYLSNQVVFILAILCNLDNKFQTRVVIMFIFNEHTHAHVFSHSAKPSITPTKHRNDG